MTTYIFNEVGSIPGIPGTFANCRVDIDEAGNLLALPLAQHPAFEASPSENAGDVALRILLAAAEEAPAIVQEQVSPDLASTSN